MRTSSSNCNISNEDIAYGQLNYGEFCVNINNLNFMPTTAKLRGDSPFQNKDINCKKTNQNKIHCKSCYKFSSKEIDQLNGKYGGLRVMLDNPNRSCEIKGNLYKT